MSTFERPLRTGSTVAFAALAALLVACGSDDGGGLGSGFGSGATGAGASPGAGGGGGGLMGASGTGSGPILTGGSGGASTGGAAGSVGVGGSCATGMAKADLTPVNMFLQFDRSGSMLDDDKWTQASAALNAFFSDASTGGLKMALRFFPHDDPAAGCWGGKGGMCSAMACSQPKVPIGEVLAAPGDPQEQALLNAVAMSAPMEDEGGGTPLYPALEGALIWARANQMATPAERTVVVLVTDGEPNGCETDIGEIAQLAEDAFTQNQIPTYVIGIAGVSEDSVEEIATAGGTMAYFAGNATTAQADLIQALNAIRGSVVACDFPVPTGTNVDPTRININYSPGGTGMPELIGQAPDMNACANGGWYYTGNQTRITLCPTTCDRVTADPAARLDVVLGCMTTVQPPR